MIECNLLIDRHLAFSPKGLQSSHRGSLHFDYFYAYSKSQKSISKLVATSAKTEQTALWLTSYLAHWGMFRGSGQLRETNILFFKYLVRELLHPNKGVLLPFFDVSFENLHKKQKSEIDEVLYRMGLIISGAGVSPTATLVSKIILGLTHTIPAYDRFLIIALRKLKEDGVFVGPIQFGGESLINLSRWYSSLTWKEIACSANGQLKLPSS